MPPDAAENHLVLDAASSRARAWLDGLSARDIPAGVTIDGVQAALGVALPGSAPRRRR